MNLQGAKKLTTVVMLVSAALIGLFDAVVFSAYGSEATISRILYYAAKDSPIIAVLFGALIGHLFWAQKIEVQKTPEDDTK